MGVTQGGCWKRLRAAPPGYPLDKVKRSQRRPRSKARLVPGGIGVPAYCELQWRPRAVNGPEIFSNCGPVLVHAANGKGIQPREADFGIHSLRHWQSNAHRRARRGGQGPGSLTGHCNSVWRRLPLTASGCLPSLRERVSGYFPSGVTTAGVPLSVFWSVATILPSFQAEVGHPGCPSSLATPNYRVTGIYFRHWAQRWICWQVAPQPRSPHGHVDDESTRLKTLPGPGQHAMA